MIRLLVADDEPLLRVGISMILTSADDIDVIAEAGDGREEPPTIAPQIRCRELRVTSRQLRENRTVKRGTPLDQCASGLGAQPS